MWLRRIYLPMPLDKKVGISQSLYLEIQTDIPDANVCALIDAGKAWRDSATCQKPRDALHQIGASRKMNLWNPSGRRVLEICTMAGKVYLYIIWNESLLCIHTNLRVASNRILCECTKRMLFPEVRMLKGGSSFMPKSTLPTAAPLTYIANPAGSLKRKILRHWQLYVIMLFPLANLVIFKYIPMIGLQIAFKTYRVRAGIWNSPFVGWKHFERFFNSPSTMQIIWNTVSISLYSIAASFPIAILLAIALNEAQKRHFKKLVQMVTYAPYFISTVVLVSMMNQFLDPRIGVISMMLQQFGVDTRNIMGNPDLFRHLYVWSGIWQSTGYSAIIYLAALTGISHELTEAATIDGCTRLQRIWHVDLPGIRPSVITLLVLNMGYVMSVGFEKVFLMQSPSILNVSEVMSTYIYRIGLLNSDFSYSTAIGLVNSLINLVLILTVNQIARKTGEQALW